MTRYNAVWVWVAKRQIENSCYLKSLSYQSIASSSSPILLSFTLPSHFSLYIIFFGFLLHYSSVIKLDFVTQYSNKYFSENMIIDKIDDTVKLVNKILVSDKNKIKLKWLYYSSLTEDLLMYLYYKS